MPLKSLLIAYWFFWAAPSLAAWHSDEQAIMGTVVRAQVWGENMAEARAALAAVMEEMRRIDRLMSPFKEDSELSRLNREAHAHPVKISPELFKLIQRALEFSVLSDGAFDITFASVGYLYDYRQGIHPSDAQIAAALPGINYRHLILDAQKQTIRYARAGTRIDLGGIAKGYAVDQCIALLQARGFREALVSAGGDSRVIGDHHGRPWMIGIRDPRQEGAAVVAIPLRDTAVSTSGDYERFFERDGIRHHHILDPKTGKSARATRSVTVIGPDATTTDGLSTTLFVLGPQKALQLLEKLPGIDAVIIDAHGKQFHTPGLTPPAPQ